jgi:hypothetical protein
MQVMDSENLRRKWGSKGCVHRNVEREYFGDTPTGQFACTVCGRTFWQSDDSRARQPLSRGN